MHKPETTARLEEALARVIGLVEEMTEDGISVKEIFGALSQQAAEVLRSQSFSVEQRLPIVNKVREQMLK